MSIVPRSSGEPEHRISVVGLYQGQLVHSVDPVPDPESELRRELGQDQDILSDKNTRRAAIEVEKTLRAAMMTAPVSGLPVRYHIDLSDDSIGRSTSR